MKKDSPSCRTKPDYSIPELRTLIWISDILRTNNLTSQQLTNMYCKRYQIESRKIIRRWLNGERNAKQQSVDRLERMFEGSRKVYDDPVFELLMNKKLKQSSIRKAQKMYRCNKKIYDFYWKLETKIRDKLITNYCEKDDSDAIFQRGGENAFRILLSLARETESVNADKHIIYAMNVIRAFPSIMKNPTFRPFQEELFSATRRVLNRQHSTWLNLRIYDDVLQEQIENPAFQPYREFREYDVKAGRYLPMKDCVDYRGWETPNSIWYYAE